MRVKGEKSPVMNTKINFQSKLSPLLPSLLPKVNENRIVSPSSSLHLSKFTAARFRATVIYRITCSRAPTLLYVRYVRYSAYCKNRSCCFPDNSSEHELKMRQDLVTRQNLTLLTQANLREKEWKLITARHYGIGHAIYGEGEF